MRLVSFLSLVVLVGCGGGGSNGMADASIEDPPDASIFAQDDATAGLPDAQDRGYDANIPANCVPAVPSTQCSDCIDNDGDGRADGLDPECISGADDRENSFATGIPGDNRDGTWQDCFFDGDSGAGNDGCRYNTCCLLGTCTAGFDCSITQECKDTCIPATPPGCDCFGCCTICVASGCYTVVTNPAVAPMCDESVVSDPNFCPTCTINTNCGEPCGGTTCVLCPGQDPSMLDPSCGGDRVCPDGATECMVHADCMDDLFRCINGCCLNQF